RRRGLAAGIVSRRRPADASRLRASRPELPGGGPVRCRRRARRRRRGGGARRRRRRGWRWRFGVLGGAAFARWRGRTGHFFGRRFGGRFVLRLRLRRFVIGGRRFRFLWRRFR